MRLGAFSHNKGRDLERQAAVVGGIGESQGTVVVGSGFVGQQGDVVDPRNRPVDVAFALSAEVEGSGLGGFEGVAWSVRFDDFGNRMDLDEDRRRGVDADGAQSQGFTGVPRGILQRQFAVAELSVSRKADENLVLSLSDLLWRSTAIAVMGERSRFTGVEAHRRSPAHDPRDHTHPGSEFRLREIHRECRNLQGCACVARRIGHLEDTVIVGSFKHGNEFDVVITDVQMPKSNGLDVLDAVNKTRPNTPVVMMTAYATAETAVDAMKKGAYDYISKPFNIEDLQLIIKNAVEKKSLADEFAFFFTG